MSSIPSLTGDESLELPEFDAPPDDPLALLATWLYAANERGVREPYAVTLSTADREGRVSARTVLLREVSEDGILIASTSSGLKAHQMTENANVALTLYWRETIQQVMIEGAAASTSADESDRVWSERTREARALAVVSDQGHDLQDESDLASRVGALAASDDPIERPVDWSAFRIAPRMIEFWHGRTTRAHRRLRYDRAEDGTWSARRLQP